MSTLSIGFTGTRHGITSAQREAVSALIAEMVGRTTGTPSPIEAHHGDCVGGDLEFDRIVEAHGAHIVVHPGPISRWWSAGITRHERRPVRPYPWRNRDIVRESTVMIAAPAEMATPGHGGTWQTIGIARAGDKPLAICYPDGSVAKERW